LPRLPRSTSRPAARPGASRAPASRRRRTSYGRPAREEHVAAGYEPEDEAADVREVRHAAAGLGRRERRAPEEELEAEPDAEVEHRGDRDDEDRGDPGQD